MDGRTNRWMGRWMVEGRMDRWKYGQIDGLVDEWMEN
jgi:hypothetical protein